jgi:hypothetical protein
VIRPQHAAAAAFGSAEQTVGPPASQETVSAVVEPFGAALERITDQAVQTTFGPEWVCARHLTADRYASSNGN